MSVNSTVASTRSTLAAGLAPVTNSSISVCHRGGVFFEEDVEVVVSRKLEQLGGRDGGRDELRLCQWDN